MFFFKARQYRFVETDISNAVVDISLTVKFQELSILLS